MKLTFRVGLVLLGLSIILNSCYCPISKGIYHFNSNDVYNFMPTINDSISFQDLSGNTHVFTKVSTKNEYYELPCESCCKGSTEEYERKRILYDSDQLTFKIQIEANSEEFNDYIDLRYHSKLPLNILYYNESYSFLEKVDINAVVNHTQSNVKFEDSLILNQKMYYKVYKFGSTINTTKYYLKEIYYTPTQGIISYKVSDGSQFYIVD